MPDILDYCDSILDLERQAIAQTKQGNRRGLQEAAQSLRNLIADCDAALALPVLSEANRQWFQAKRDKAASAIV
jgi:hypothetical protein